MRKKTRDASLNKKKKNDEEKGHDRARLFLFFFNFFFAFFLYREQPSRPHIVSPILKRNCLVFFCLLFPFANLKANVLSPVDALTTGSIQKFPFPSFSSNAVSY